jgi:hypothetical protein
MEQITEEELARDEMFKMITDWERYNLRVGQVFDQTFDRVKKDGKDPFGIDNKELLEYMKIAYKGIVNE